MRDWIRRYLGLVVLSAKVDVLTEVLQDNLKNQDSLDSILRSRHEDICRLIESIGKKEAPLKIVELPRPISTRPKPWRQIKDELERADVAQITKIKEDYWKSKGAVSTNEESNGSGIAS